MVLIILFISSFAQAAFMYRPQVKNQNNADILFQIEAKIQRNCRNTQSLLLIGEAYKADPPQVTYSIQTASGVLYYNSLIVSSQSSQPFIVIHDQLSLCRR